MFKAALALVAFGGMSAWAQPAPAAAQVDRASAYYHYTLAHMYAELAGAYGNSRGDYLNKAIENYKIAIKADPQTAMLAEELSDLYIQSGRLREGQSDAEDALKQNPNDINAHRLLARIFTRQIGDSQQNRVDEAMVKRATEEYKKITELAPKDVDSWVMLGRLYKLSQDSVEAQNAYKKALEVDPASEDALTGLAMVYSDLGDNNRAASILKQLADKSPSARSLQALAGAYEQMKEYALAAETLRKALDLNPAGANDVKRAMAQDLLQANQIDDALKTYQEIIDEEPDDAESYLRISQIYQQKQDYANARKFNDKAKELDPQNLEIRYNEVAILDAEGKTNDAIQMLKDVIASTAKRTYNPPERGNRVSLLEKLARLYEGADQTDNAVSTLRQIADLDSDLGPKVEVNVINAYVLGKEFTKAQGEADAAVKKYPDDRELKVSRATVMADLGKADAAAAEVKKLLGGKNDRDTYYSLALIYDKGKKWNDEAKALDEVEKASDSKEQKEAVWYQRGAMFERMKKVEQSEAEFRKIIESDPNGNYGASAYNYLGYMLADRDIRLQEALQLIKKALDQDPANPAFLDSLGWVYFRLNRFEEAEENIRRALTHSLRDPTVHDHLGEILLKENKVKEAIAQFDASLKEWDLGAPADLEPDEVAKVKSTLETARVRLAKEGSPNPKQ